MINAITSEHVWIAIGLLGQLLFGLRFVVQWIVTEKKKESVIPIAFWYFSLGGGLVLFVYSFYRRDPVFIIGQGLGIIIYARNLYLIVRKKKQTPPAK